MPRIHLVHSGLAGQERIREAPTIAIDRLPCVIGRASGCDHRINDPMISRRHCALSFRDGEVWVEDLHSLNGTRVDGKPVLGPRTITDGATLQLGQFAFLLRLADVADKPHSITDGLTGARAGEVNSIR
jgi:pSer/pThr/pTyr-binding forkhead associated (FHA) protein